MLHAIKIGKDQVELYAVRGEIADVETWTTVTGSGGGGTITQGDGEISAVKIQSQVHQRLYIRAGDGVENVVELVDAGFAARPSHSVTVLWGRRSGHASGTKLAVHNHSTKQTAVLRNADVLASGGFFALTVLVLGLASLGAALYYFYGTLQGGASLPNALLNHEGPGMILLGVVGSFASMRAWKKLAAKRADRSTLSSAFRAALKQIEAEA